MQQRYIRHRVKLSVTLHPSFQHPQRHEDAFQNWITNIYMCSIFRDSSAEATFRPRLPTQEYWNHQENAGSHQATGWIFWTIYKKRKYPADKPSHRSIKVCLIFMPLFITNKDLMFNDMSCSFGILAWTTELPHHDTYIIPLRFLYQNTGHKT